MGRIAVGGRSFLPSQVALTIGVAYLFVPIDLIPDRTPVIGHVDELAFLVVGFVAAHKLVPPRKAIRQVGKVDSLAPKPASSVRVVPNFFIVGAPRCGTTSLFDTMSRHPDVFCCPVKEPNHFAIDRNTNPHVIASAVRRGVLLTEGAAGMAVLPRVATTPDYETYLSLFNGWTGQHAVGEASTFYLMSEVAPAEIARRRPDARIIVVLRQPVERAQSEYLMHAQLGRTMGSLDSIDAVLPNPADGEGAIKSRTIIETSLYAPQIERYLHAFAREQMLFLRFEDVVHNPSDVLRRVYQHIGVDPDFSVETNLSHQNQTRSVRFPALNRLLFRSGLRDVILHGLPSPVRKLLAKRYYGTGARTRPTLPLDLFRTDIAKTERLTGLDLSAWIREPAAA